MDEKLRFVARLLDGEKMAVCAGNSMFRARYMRTHPQRAALPQQPTWSPLHSLFARRPPPTNDLSTAPQAISLSILDVAPTLPYAVFACIHGELWKLG